MPKTLLDIVRECDNFPYQADNPEFYKATLAEYYAFKVAGSACTLGHVPHDIVSAFDFSSCGWAVDHDAQTVTLGHNQTIDKFNFDHEKWSSALTATMSTTTAKMSKSPHPALSKLSTTWRNETFPIANPVTGRTMLEIERSASAIFGILTSGVQLTCYVEDPARGLLLWIARRSRTKQTYPGLLDNTAAGGLETRFSTCPLEAVVREAVEEASLDEEIVRRGIRPSIRISYYHAKAPRAEGPGFLQPEVEGVYSLRLEPGVVPVPGDGEVEGFYLWSVEEVLGALRNREFKLNSAVAVIDFLVRRRVVTAENEAGYAEIVSRLHRRLDLD
ncbi:NUDIX hydrolase [Aspergillus mulundensis]|uniref:Nudix hydrolase domain-containing protein n=1 Tax=Aspergillus mulundensis TaxID=1810919 RepID=A0A3D8RYN2_9EURO|nr:hypothetical protein DSM5745_05988 [Aspergillus mulundensis]RDW79136.1 hypothetical protein DSM5745_05988 [Aspergillus mulundensis]